MLNEGRRVLATDERDGQGASGDDEKHWLRSDVGIRYGVDIALGQTRWMNQYCEHSVRDSVTAGLTRRNKRKGKQRVW